MEVIERYGGSATKGMNGNRRYIIGAIARDVRLALDGEMQAWVDAIDSLEVW